MTTKTDWTKVPAGTMIHVKDYEVEEWDEREFVRYDPSYPFPYFCKTIDGYGNQNGRITSWSMAKLIEEQPEVTPVHTVKFENNHAVVAIVVEHKITQAEYEMIKRVYPDHKVTIIKYIRSLRNLGLVETKKICDTICGLN